MFERVKGLSPRGRGSRLLGVVDMALERSIPAWAGEPFQLLFW